MKSAEWPDCWLNISIWGNSANWLLSRPIQTLCATFDDVKLAELKFQSILTWNPFLSLIIHDIAVRQLKNFSLWHCIFPWLMELGDTMSLYQGVYSNPYPDLKKSNLTHRHQFIFIVHSNFVLPSTPDFIEFSFLRVIC